MAIATCLSCLGATARADALGFLQESTGSSRVGVHRVALAVSPDRTVLWDELRYSGQPRDFLWLLPVRPGVTFEVANPAWFDTLQAVTEPRVGALRSQCVDLDTGGGCGCYSSPPEPTYYGDSYNYGVPGVQVIRSSTVGPYRTNVIGSSDPGALADYIAAGGYVVPPGFDATIAAYMADGYDFLAVSVRPTVGVADMRPIRVVTPGGLPVLPLRMLAAGAEPVVNVELYVIAEGRQGLPELTEVTIDPRKLTWNPTTNTSNYQALETEALARNSGMSYLTTFASSDPFGMRHLDADGRELRFTVSAGSTQAYTLADLYFAQGRLEAATAVQSCQTLTAGLRSNLEVTDMNPPGPDQLDDLLFACGPLTDLQQALIGMHPSEVWLTRMDLALPVDALAQDYVVLPQSTGVGVSPNHAPTQLSNGTQTCEEPIFRSSVAPRKVRPFGWAAVPVALAAAVLRRRLRRARGAT